MQIGRGHLLHHLAAGRHPGEVGGSLRGAGALPGGNHRAGEERLLEVNLALGEVVAGDEGEPRRNDAAGKERGEVFDDAGAKAQRGQILLVDAEIAGERDGGQELLQGLFLLALERLFAVFGFLEAQVVLEAESDGIVERELEGLISGRADCDAAEEGVGGRGGVGRLSREARRRGREDCDGDKNRRGRMPEDDLVRSIHYAHSLR